MSQASSPNQGVVRRVYGKKMPMKSLYALKKIPTYYYHREENESSSDESQPTDSQPPSRMSSQTDQTQRDLYYLNTQPSQEPVSVVPEVRAQQQPEPNDGPLVTPNITSEPIVDIEPKPKPKSDEEEEEEEEINELEAYEFIKNNPKFFSYEIKHYIIEHYEKTCVYGSNQFEQNEIDKKIMYIKMLHPKWYEATYEAVIRDMALVKNNKPKY